MNDKTGRHSNASPSKLSVGYLTQNRVVSLFRVATCAFFSFVVACDDSPADSVDARCTIQEDGCSHESDCGTSSCFDAVPDFIIDSSAGSDIQDELSLHQDVPAAELDEGPVLNLKPSTTLDFGMVAVGTTYERIVHVTNDGKEDLKVTFEFPVEGDLYEEFSCKTEFPITIASLESSKVPVFFTNKGVQSGEITLTMQINSNQTAGETSSLILHADHGQKAPCIPSLTPAQIDFGTVSTGSTNTATVGISNSGSGYCTFRSLRILDCETAGDSYNCPSPLDADDSSSFALATDVSKIQANISPDQTLNLDITFSPPIQDARTSFVGLMLIRVADETYNVLHQLPVEDSVEGYQPNLIGSVGDSGG